MDSDSQMSFEFQEQPAGDNALAEEKKTSRKEKLPLRLKKSVLGWLAIQTPSGIAVDVPTRISRYKASIAAFWSIPVRKILKPEKTLIVEIKTGREECWPDCGEKDKLLPILAMEKSKLERLREIVKKEEPFLRENDSLFDDIDIWRFEKSENKEYHKCVRKIEKLEHAVYKGSVFEKIRTARVADYLYLAVPDGTVKPSELADGWGLLYIKDDLSVEIAASAFNWNSSSDNRYHLIQNMAVSSVHKILFTQGVNLSEKGLISFSAAPKRRRRSF
ncbi:MAG: hypothetical protein A2020_12485 [Lentisphaerae bacterium GWF2_45_14]|nr:MAG: hypothetical protein A2020_12485 [Lentisphaerae bacterium GWF2_45_14]